MALCVRKQIKGGLGLSSGAELVYKWAGPVSIKLRVRSKWPRFGQRAAYKVFLGQLGCLRERFEPSQSSGCEQREKPTALRGEAKEAAASQRTGRGS